MFEPELKLRLGSSTIGKLLPTSQAGSTLMVMSKPLPTFTTLRCALERSIAGRPVVGFLYANAGASSTQRPSTLTLKRQLPSGCCWTAPSCPLGSARWNTYVVGDAGDFRISSSLTPACSVRYWRSVSVAPLSSKTWLPLSDGALKGKPAADKVT